MAVTIGYLGHSAFLVSTPKGIVLIDPFLSGNPMASARPEELDADIILVTHGHGDHLGDAIPIARRTGAVIVAAFELANYCAERGARTADPQPGGEVEFLMGSVKLFPAIHSSSIDGGPFLGQAASFVLSVEGKSIYHAGDTALFGDMALIGEEFELDLACVPIGGHYTMGIDDAVRAIKLLRPKKVVPMHYGTFEIIDVDPLGFKRKVEKATRSECVVLQPGDRLDI